MNKCYKCDSIDVSKYGNGLCYNCERKEETTVFLLLVGFCLFLLLCIGIARVAWAEIVFDDWRCALSECRIIKE